MKSELAVHACKPHLQRRHHRTLKVQSQHRGLDMPVHALASFYSEIRGQTYETSITCAETIRVLVEEGESREHEVVEA